MLVELEIYLKLFFLLAQFRFLIEKNGGYFFYDFIGKERILIKCVQFSKINCTRQGHIICFN